MFERLTGPKGPEMRFRLYNVLNHGFFPEKLKRFVASKGNNRFGRKVVCEHHLTILLSAIKRCGLELVFTLRETGQELID